MNAPEPVSRSLVDRATAELLRVPVVDDKPRAQEAIRRTLEAGFRVLCARDTQHARQRPDGHAVDIIFSDQRMPGESGVDLLRNARERSPPMPCAP